MTTNEIFNSTINVLKSCDSLYSLIDDAAAKIIYALSNGNKILTCGNGGSAADAQHFSAELLCRFEVNRCPLPVVALSTDTSTITAIGNDYSFDEIFSKQIQAHGIMDDVLLVFTTSGNSPNIIKAVDAALDRDMVVIAITGKNGGDLIHQYGNEITSIIVPSMNTARIQEVHQVIIHCLCTKIDSIKWDEIF